MPGAPPEPSFSGGGQTLSLCSGGAQPTCPELVLRAYVEHHSFPLLGRGDYFKCRACVVFNDVCRCGTCADHVVEVGASHPTRFTLWRANFWIDATVVRGCGECALP